MTDRIRDLLGDLPNKPLAEAIFELRWAIDSPQPGIHRDLTWELLPGLYYARVEPSYPHVVRLSAADLPVEITGYMVKQQFRPGPDRWPLIQLGPGILTVNQASEYTVWEAFRPKIIEAIEALYHVYPRDKGPIKPLQVDLRYINALPIDPGTTHLTNYLRDQLHTTITVDADVFNGSQEPPSPTELNLAISFPLLRPAGVISLNLARGKKHDNPSMIWQLVVESKKTDVPKTVENLTTWLDDAHRVIEQWFLKLSAGPLMETFRKS
jgi:uncharacterized protein (TIGR04255 family)